MTAIESSYKWKVLATVAVATMMGAMDFTFVNLSLPVLTKTFKTDLATAVWLNLIFSVVLVSLGPFLGKANDRIGRKRVFVAGAACMTVSLLICSMAQTMGQLIAFRIIHAVGNAMLSTSFAALITDAFPSDERGRGLGLQSASLSLGFMVGPVAAGFLLNWLDWRSIFYVRAPVGIIVLLMAVALLKKDEPRTEHIKFDLAGTFTSALGLLSLVLGITMISRLGLQSPVIWSLILAGVFLLALFVRIERRAEDPIVELSLFRNRAFSGALLSLLFYWMAVQGYAVTMPFYLMEGRGIPAPFVGLLFTVGSIVSFLASPLAGSLSDRFGPGLLSSMGAALLIVALCFYFSFGPQTQMLFIVCAFVIMGIGGGVYGTSNASAVMGAVGPEQRGPASALMASITGLSLSIGMSWASTVFSMRRLLHQTHLSGQGLGADVVARQSIHLSFHEVLVVSMCLQVLVLVCAFLPGIMVRLEGRAGKATLAAG